LLVIAGMFLAAHDRLLAEVVIAAGGHRLLPSLVDARLVPRLPGPVPRLTVGGTLALAVLPPLVLPGIAALAVATSVRPVHLPTPFHYHSASLSRLAAGDSLAIVVIPTPFAAAFTSRRPLPPAHLCFMESLPFMAPSALIGTIRAGR
jgi:hypothetical protein